MQAISKSGKTTSGKSNLPASTPWIVLGMNIVAGLVSLLGHYKKETDKVFMSPYTHVHYIDTNGNYICGDKYINKRHVCDGRFLNVRADIPTLDTFLSLGLTKENWDTAQKMIKQFKCGELHEKN